MKRNDYDPAAHIKRIFSDFCESLEKGGSTFEKHYDSAVKAATEISNIYNQYHPKSIHDHMCAWPLNNYGVMCITNAEDEDISGKIYRYKLAVKAFKKALTFAPHDPKANENLAKWEPKLESLKWQEEKQQQEKSLVSYKSEQLDLTDKKLAMMFKYYEEAQRLNFIEQKNKIVLDRMNLDNMDKKLELAAKAFKLNEKYNHHHQYDNVLTKFYNDITQGNLTKASGMLEAACLMGGLSIEELND